MTIARVGDYISMQTGGYWKVWGGVTTGSDFEQGLYSYLSGNSDVTDLISTRIYPSRIPQGATLPVLVYQLINSKHIRSTIGSSGAVEARYQLTSWAETRAAVKQLAEVVRLQLDGYDGAMGDVTVFHCLLEDDGDMIEPMPGVEELLLYGVRQDFMIYHDETKPSL